MPLVTPEELAARRREVQRSSVLRDLAERLGRLVQPLDRPDIYLPSDKALLSGDGGVCAEDGSRLVFDPLRPHHHRCPRCDVIHQGDRHHRAWVWRYHLWLSERAIHLALLGRLTENERCLDLARQVLDNYAVRYRSYPNSDNVLGPTRLFFSTYLESIWLVQIVTAAWLLNGARPSTDADRKTWARLNEMVRESVALVESFNEAWSNRQVWNNTALIAAGRWLGDERLVASGLDGRFGIRAQLTSRVSEEGLWYEGENYHFFALRGFAFAAAFVRPIGVDLYGDDGPSGVLAEMFAAPLKTLLPDLTLPARSDAPFGVSVLQPRFAELWEIGWARTNDTRLGAILNELYHADGPDGEDGGFSELAEQEQNRPPQRLRRDRLSWKALLWMSPNPPDGGECRWRRESRLLPNAGLAVLRTSPERYVGIECGGRAGGHGHPDLLHLTLFWGAPFLLDFGTASYVSPSLHWYRSSLAHNAPASVVSGQVARMGACVAIDSDGDWAWCRVVAENLFGEDTEAIRTVVVGPSYVLDVVETRAAPSKEIELPIHPIGGFDVEPLETNRVTEFAHCATGSNVLGPIREVTSSPHLTLANKKFRVHFAPRTDERVFVVEAPGPPSLDFADGGSTPFVLRRARGSGKWVQCYAKVDGPVERIEIKGADVFVVQGDDRHDRIRVRARSCTIELADGGTRRLSGTRALSPERPQAVLRHPRIFCPIVDSPPPAANWSEVVPAAAIIELGSRHYRRSETPYGARGRFSARVAVVTVGTALWFVVDVTKRSLMFRPANAPDPQLDNEIADIHSDGVQCYVDWNGWSGFLVVPEAGSGRVRITPVAGAGRAVSATEGRWHASEQGYSIVIRMELDRVLVPGEGVPVNVVVNEMYADRQRRAGQLALSGGGWVYLRGDREDRNGALLAVVR